MSSDTNYISNMIDKIIPLHDVGKINKGLGIEDSNSSSDDICCDKMSDDKISSHYSMESIDSAGLSGYSLSD